MKKLIKSKKGFKFGLEELGYLILGLGALAIFAYLLYLSMTTQGGVFRFLENILGI